MKKEYPFPHDEFKIIINLFRDKKISKDEMRTITDLFFKYIELKIFYQRRKISTLANDENAEKFLRGFAYKPTERVKEILLMQKEIEETIELRDNYIGELESELD